MSRKNGKRGVISHIFWILVLGGFIAGCVFFAPYVMDVLGLETDSKEIVFEVAPDEDTDTVSHKLREAGVVRSARVYRTVVKRDHGNLTYTPGTYTLKANMSFDRIVSVLQSEPDVDKSIIKVTFPEGKTIAEMAEILEENGICKAADFIKSQQEDDFDYDFVKEIENVEDRGYRLEGYLFPATYELQRNSEAKDVVNKMLAALNERITPAMKTRMIELNVSFDEILTLASLVQSEVSSEVDIKMVASVFWNRHNSADFPKFESDPTITYSESLVSNGVLPKEKALEYDTYKSEGLPPGPQNNPGFNMIEGVLYPEESDNYFFVSNVKTGETFYAKTNAEHESNINRIRMENAQ